MKLTAFFRSVMEQDPAPIVLCDLDHTIIYMNKSAVERYSKYGGESLLGQSLLKCHSPASCGLINKSLDWFDADGDNNIVYESYNEKENKDVYIVALRDECGKLIGYYEKHEYRNRETGKMYDFTTGHA